MLTFVTFSGYVDASIQGPYPGVKKIENSFQISVPFSVYFVL